MCVCGWFVAELSHAWHAGGIHAHAPKHDTESGRKNNSFFAIATSAVFDSAKHDAVVADGQAALAEFGTIPLAILWRARAGGSRLEGRRAGPGAGGSGGKRAWDRQGSGTDVSRANVRATGGQAGRRMRCCSEPVEDTSA